MKGQGLKKIWTTDKISQSNGAGVGIGSMFGNFRKDVARNPRGGEKKLVVGGGRRGLATNKGAVVALGGGKPLPDRSKRKAFSEKTCHLFGRNYVWHFYTRNKTLQDHCSIKDKNLAAVLETTGSLLADHCHTNQREAVMVTVIFYRAQSPEESLRGAFDLLKNLREWLEAAGGDFLLSTVELHRLGSPEPRASDGFSELSGGEEEEETAGDRREAGSALTVSVGDD
jgi:hypothetical protein